MVFCWFVLLIATLFLGSGTVIKSGWDYLSLPSSGAQGPSQLGRIVGPGKEEKGLGVVEAARILGRVKKLFCPPFQWPTDKETFLVGYDRRKPTEKG